MGGYVFLEARFFVSQDQYDRIKDLSEKSEMIFGTKMDPESIFNAVMTMSGSRDYINHRLDKYEEAFRQVMEERNHEIKD